MRVSPVRAGAVLAATLMLGACADKPPPTPAPATRPSATAAAPAGGSASATPAVPGMPTPISVASSPVDAVRLHSIDDLPSAFGCPSSVTPIRIPAPAPEPSATVAPAPDAVVCASALADKEAIYLWYTPTPEVKAAALTYALARTKYVHAGPNWVAAGMVNPTMGSVGGEVYR